MCGAGTKPSTLNATAQSKVLVDGKPAATVNDKEMLNIGSFGMCTSMMNPQVAAATAAALGVLTPQPCMPQATFPWADTHPKLKAGGVSLLGQDSTLSCLYCPGGISITNPSQTKTMLN